MVSAATRPAGFVFAVNVQVSLAFPEPLDGLTVSHAALLVAVHDAVVVRLTAPVPAAFVTVAEGDERETAATACIMVSTCPFNRITAVRAKGVLFGASA